MHGLRGGDKLGQRCGDGKNTGEEGKSGNLDGMGPDTQAKRGSLTLRTLGSHCRILSKGET